MSRKSSSYGAFDNEHSEYVITNPHTPVKWINYIGTLAFGGFVDHTGGALICKNDPTFNRITKYIQQMPDSDFKGETLYLRINNANKRKVFSPFFVPTLDPFDLYECHVGLGYTCIISQFFGLRTEVLIFVPSGENREIRDITITNISKSSLDVDAIPVVEYTHPDALKQFTNADWLPQTMQSKCIVDHDFRILIQYPFMFRDAKINFFTSNLPAASFETDRRLFLGENGYGTWAHPESLSQPDLSNTEALRGDNIAALMHHLGAIAPGETRHFITQLGQDESLKKALPGIEHFRQPEAVASALEEYKRFWRKYLAVFQVDTPDMDMNTMLNIHNPRQCYITKTWSRYLSYYQLGLGSRGIGMRDSSQDILAVLASVPEESKDFIRTLLSFQRIDGSAVHQFNPLTHEGSVGDSADLPDRPHYYSDDHLWVVLAVTAYLKETGDFDFLKEVIPFYEKNKTDHPMESKTVAEHLLRALTFTRDNVGKHGLPLLGFADWNDTVNLPTGAESLFTANLYGKALVEMIALQDYLGDTDVGKHLKADYETMRAHFQQVAWDGDWFIRYFDAEGNPIGSASNIFGQIHLNGQSWPVISGFASPGHGRQAMDIVYKRLNTRYGIKLTTPGFNGYDPKFGGITTYPPGAKENGGIFLHPNPWAMIAETILGNGDRAYEYYSQINPVTKNDIIDTYECEPYVYAQNILGDDHPQFGLGRNSWLSGTASWCYQAATQWILGIRPEYKGLRIDPCIPSNWKDFSVTRKFRGSQYHIVVKNPDGTCKGVKQMVVDGNKVSGNLIPLGLHGKKHQVEVWLGK